MGKTKQFVYDHVKACKPYDVEEIIDLTINRRVAAPIVKLLLNTKITPNQITLVSLIIGVLAALLLMINNLSPLISGFMIYFSLILDCVDGQLARSRDQASMSGRILDGLVDYINTTAYFVAMLVFLLNNIEGNRLLLWILVAGGGFSDLTHSVLYDYYKNMYITYAIKGYDERIDSLDEINQELNESVKKREWSKILTLRIYKTYLNLQNIFVSSTNKTNNANIKNEHFDEGYAKVYRRYHQKLIRIWSALGMSAHVTPIAIFALVSAFDPRGFVYCCIYFVAVMNPFMIILLFIQISRSKKTEKTNSL